MCSRSSRSRSTSAASSACSSEGRRANAAGKPAEAAARASDEALGLWRGRALADLAYEPFARAEIERLEELRLAALEERIDAELALGRHRALVAELESLTAKHPLARAAARAS